MAEIVYLNGEFIPLAEARISVLDYGLLFGYALFETMHAYNSTVFRMDGHLERLKKSADKLGIAIDIGVLRKAIIDTLSVNRLKEARVRLILSAGKGKQIIDLSSCTGPTFLVMATPHIPIAAGIYERGYRIIVSDIHRDSRSPIHGMKKTDYMENILARQTAKNAGADDALFLNERGNVTEGTTNNIFLVMNNKLITPPVSSGILPGITRDVVLELASQSFLTTGEADFNKEELADADEVFLTSSMMEIMPVTMIDGKVIGSGQPGETTRRLMQAYKALVNTETAV